jgi:hypothetical protein
MAGRTKGRRTRRDAPHAGRKVRCVVYLPEETVRQWGLACLAERRKRAEWLEQVIASSARRYSLHVRDGAERQGEAAA